MQMKFKGKKQVTQDLGFKPQEELDFLTKGHLVSVKVVEKKVEKKKDDGSDNLWEYAGFTVPHLQFTFIQAKKDKNERNRVLNHVENVITFKSNEGVAIDMSVIESLFEQMNDRVVHIHDAFKDEGNYAPMPDFEFSQGATIKERLEAFKVLFENIAQAFNVGLNDKPLYIDKDGKPVPLYIKILPEYKRGTYYTLPTYVNKGFIERCHGSKPFIELTATEKANIELRSSKGGAVAGKEGSVVQQDEIDDEIAKLVS